MEEQKKTLIQVYNDIISVLFPKSSDTEYIVKSYFEVKVKNLRIREKLEYVENTLNKKIAELNKAKENLVMAEFDIYSGCAEAVSAVQDAISCLVGGIKK